MSHLPHAAAFALVAATAGQGPLSDMDFAGKGWADSSRIAASDDALWADIFLHHPKRIDQGLKGLAAEVARLRRLLKAGQAAPLRAWLRKAARFRQASVRPPR